MWSLLRVAICVITFTSTRYRSSGGCTKLRGGSIESVYTWSASWESNVLRIPDTKVKEYITSLAEKPAEIIRKIRPSAIYYSHINDRYDDHRVTHIALNKALDFINPNWWILIRYYIIWGGIPSNIKSYEIPPEVLALKKKHLRNTCLKLNYLVGNFQDLLDHMRFFSRKNTF